MQLGFPTCNVGGFEVGSDEKKLAEKHMNPLVTLEPPKNVPELRRCLGLFVQINSFVPNFAIIARPLTRLTGKVPWKWGEDEQLAFDELKTMTCARPTMAAPNYDRKFFVDTDASEYGYGFMLYHESERKDDDGAVITVKEPIMFGSKSWKTQVMLDRPIFFKEGIGMFRALKACRHYIESSRFTTVVRTDHKPLTWVKHAHKGPLTNWVVHECADLDYEIEYIPGEVNGCADACSRSPFVQRPLVSEGADVMLDNLLKNVGPKFKNATTMWVWSCKDSGFVAKMVQDWRNGTNPVLKMAPTKEAFKKNWNAAVFMPSGDKAPSVCAEMLRGDRPAACLCPSDLVHWVPLADSKRLPLEVDEKVRDALQRTTKIVMLNTGLTWLVHDPDNDESCDIVFRVHVVATEGAVRDVYVTQLGQQNDAKVADNHKSEVGDVRSDWIQEQQQEKDQLVKGVPDNSDVVPLSSGLLVLLQENQTAKILVPKLRRRAVTLQAHTALKHRGWRKVVELVKKTYYWPHMASQIKKWTEECRECPVFNCRRNLKHNQFSSVVYEGPRTAFAFDFYSVAKSEDGYQWVLTVIDLFSREVQFLPLRTRTAEETLTNLLRYVIFRCGVPSIFMSDEAPEFMGKLLSGLCATLGINHVTTKGYNPAANGICETVHTYLGKCLAMLPQEKRKQWPMFLAEFSFANNTTKHAALGYSPFEIAHGVQARTVVDAMGMLEAEEVMPTKDVVEGYFGRLVQRASAYKKLALHNQSLAAEDTMNRLNHGKPRQYVVGDLVSVYFPSRGLSSGWKPKHMPKWRGPMRVTKKLSKSTYEVNEISSGRTYQRSIANINRYKAPPGAPQCDHKEQAKSAMMLTVDDVVATKDSNDAKEFWLAKVLDIDAGECLLHYFGTSGKKKSTALFRPAHIGCKTGMTILAVNPKQRDEETMPWTGKVDQSLILGKVLLAGPNKSGARKMTKASLQVVQGMVMARM